MNVALKDLIRGDRFIGSDGRDWTVLANDGATVTAVDIKGAKRIVHTGPFVVDVTNRDDTLTEADAIANIQQAGMSPTIISIEP